jgi:AP-1 complex subunit beta-1
VLIELIHPDNVLDILYELKEYAGEVDIDFARKAIQCIGRCAVTVSETSKQCVDVLLEIINTKVNYAVQEAIVVMKDILRRYPGQYEGMIKHLCDVLESLDEPEAKRSFIWILGEYADRIENIIDLLASFVEGISDESITVQLQILSSVVKLFFKLPSEEAKVIVQQALQFATNESEHPDLRDRAYVYWRLLSHVDMNSATGVIVTGALPPAL